MAHKLIFPKTKIIFQIFQISGTLLMLCHIATTGQLRDILTEPRLFYPLNCPVLIADSFFLDFFGSAGFNVDGNLLCAPHTHFMSHSREKWGRLENLA